MALRRAAPHLRLACADLFFGRLLVIVAQSAHQGSGEEFADVGQKPLAIVMAPVRPEGNRRVAQVAQVAHRLTIGTSAELRLLQDRLFELGVADLAICHSRCCPDRTHESCRDESSYACHVWSDLCEGGPAPAPLASTRWCERLGASTPETNLCARGAAALRRREFSRTLPSAHRDRP